MQEPYDRRRKELGARHHRAGVFHGGAGHAGHHDGVRHHPQPDLSATIETLQWTVNAYNLSFAVLLLTGAALGDRFGRRRMFAAGIALFVLASAACALAGTASTR